MVLLPTDAWSCRPGDAARRFCDGSQPQGVGQAAHQASKRHTRSTSAQRQTARNQGNLDGRRNRCESCRGARRRSLTRSPDRSGKTHKSCHVPGGYRRAPPCVQAGVRRPVSGRTSVRSDIAADAGMAADTSLATADISCPEGVVPEPPDGQSADRSGSLQFLLLFRPACGWPAAAVSAGIGAAAERARTRCRTPVRSSGPSGRVDTFVWRHLHRPGARAPTEDYLAQ
jgi:hypothetical protein